MPTSTTVSSWSRHSRQWSLIGSPLRPDAEDCRLFWDLIGEIVESRPAPRALMLGVTPELALLPWPGNCHLTAVDQNPDMIGRVWPAGDLHCTGEAMCAKWQEMPLADASIDVALGDGSLTALPSSREYPHVIAEIHRVLKPGGRLALRCYVPPDDKETTDQIFTALDAGEIGSMNTLKWRIAMALQKTPADGVTVPDIRDCVVARIVDREAAARRLGWPVEAINAIDAYKDSSVAYSFPTLAELGAVTAGRFKIDRIAYPSYELGERCPVVEFQRLP